jgi:chemotaxis protein MotB
VSKTKGAKIIVVKKKKAAHGGHHGGAWKVAYADFVTAMMALFMVLWILGMDQQLRKAIEGYFSNPVGFKKGYSGGSSPLATGSSPASVKTNTMSLMSRQFQLRRFNEIREGLVKQIDSAAQMGLLKAKVEVLVTESGLRIELVESGTGETFFPFGSAQIKPAGRIALGIIARELTALENPIIIEGHTDGAPFHRGDYSNWELSNDRANAARRILESDGLSPDRIIEVNGLADRKPRNAANPRDPSNRRISLVIPFVLPPAPIATPTRESIRRTAGG